MITVHGADRPVLLCSLVRYSRSTIVALISGFPLSKGSLDSVCLPAPGITPFDLRSGCTFDLWADDTPVFKVCVKGDDIWISRCQSSVPMQPSILRLRRGLEENIGLVQAKSIVALLAEREGERCH